MFLNQNNPLDRLWAATQPSEPSAEAFDTLWAKVTARVSEPEPPAVLVFTSWKRWGLSVAIAAQAATLLIAGYVTLNRPSSAPPVGRSVATATRVHDLRGEVGMTLVVSLGLESGMLNGSELRPQVTCSETDMVAVETDVLSFMESFRTIPVHNLRAKEGETLFVSLDGIGELARVETRPQLLESETDMVAVESDVLNFMESFK